jgi:uncharacterized RDD family membrane protein YckC
MKFLLGLFFVLLQVHSVLAVTPELKEVREFPEEIYVGTPLEVTFEVTHLADTKVHFPNPIFLAMPLKLVTQTQTQEENPRGVFRESFTLQLTSFRTGKQTIPSFDVPYIVGEETFSLQTEPISFQVGSRLANELNPTLREPGPPLLIYHRNWLLLWTMFGLAAMAFTVLGTLLAIRIFGVRYAHQPQEEPSRPAHEIAFERLEELENGEWKATGDFKLFFFELTEILRQYLDNRYRTGALAETTTELLAEMEQLAPVGLSLDSLRELLSQSDLIKFARSSASESEAISSIALCKSLVKDTLVITPEETEKEEEEEEFQLVDAPFGLRLAGILVDFAIITGLATLLLFVTGTALIWEGQVAMVVLVMSVMALVKDALNITLGKRLMGLELISESGERLDAWGRLKRNVLLMIPVLGWTASLVWSLLDPNHRRPGDRLTHSATQVVHQAKVSPALAGGLGFLLATGFLLAMARTMSTVIGGALG